MKTSLKLAISTAAFLLLQISSNAADTTNTLPENAWLGDNGVWYCDDGFKKADNACAAIQIPENAFAYGSEWYCKTGFVRSQSKCVSKTVASSIASQGSDTPLAGSIAASPKSFTSSQPAAQQPSSNSSFQATQPSPIYSRACAENGSCYGDTSVNTGRPKTVRVGGYYRGDGTYVRGHYRSKPRR